MALKKGTQARQKVFAAQGEVRDLRIDADSGAVQYLLAYAGPDGEPTERWFDEEQIEQVEGTQ